MDEMDTQNIGELKRIILETRAAIAIWRAEFFLKRYNPNQPRVPAGSPDGGQWTNGTRDDIAASLGRLTPDECWEL